MTVHDVVIQNGRPWIVMELVGGQSLAQELRERRLHGELGHVPPAEHEALHAMPRPVTATLKTS